MIFGLFRDEELDRFAKGLAKELSTRISPVALGAEQPPNSKAQATVAKALQHVSLAVQNYRRSHKVGLFKKVRLSKVFQDELASLGYQEEFIKDVTWALADQLSKL